MINQQLAFWDVPVLSKETVESALNTRKVELLPLDEYDYYLISTSGGKDSLACLLYLLNQGVPKNKIELWHQSIDGKPGKSIPFADWPVTESYVRVMGEAFGIKVRFQWREEGFLGELMRENRMSLGVGFETNSQVITLPTTQGAISTRRKFPAKAASLRTRWCSSNLKIEVFARSLNNFPEFSGSSENPLKILVFTGERREESAARSHYAETELHRCSTRSRIVHQWRAVIDFAEEDIWALIEKYRITPHPAYILGWSRTSCCCCIFSAPDHWAMLREIMPERFNMWRAKEKELQFTVDSKYNLEELANRGSLCRLNKTAQTSYWVQKALSGNFIVDDFFTDKWELPTGAFGGSEGGAI